MKNLQKDVMKVEQLARSLEAQNPTPSPLKSPLLNGRWALQYTTCKSILRRGPAALLRPNGPIYQTVDIFNLKASGRLRFQENAGWPGLRLLASVSDGLELCLRVFPRIPFLECATVCQRLQMLNEEQYEPLPFIKWTSSSSSNLDAKSNSRAEVKPDQFRVGPFKVTTPS